MILYLFKSTVALSILLLLYHWLLEKEKMHQFNRFYLLFSLVFSMSIPFYTIEIIKKITATPITKMDIIDTPGTVFIAQENTNYLQISFLSLYIIITAVLLIRFTHNLLQFNKKKHNNTSVKHKNTTIVLLEEITLPYTFLSIVFMNKGDYESKKIEPELFTHELIHVNQKHSLDILFIEILKTIFWFNPIFIYYKKAIQLNHEFLADEKVVQSHNNVSYYQNLLIAKANTNPTYYLASNLNYSVTKKRLIMMTKTASSKQNLLKKAIVLPILTGLVFLLCTKNVAQVTTEKDPTTKKQESQGGFYDKTTFKIKDEKGKVASEKKYEELTPAEIKTLPSLSARTLEEAKAKAEKGAPETIEIDLFDPKNIKVLKGENDVYSLKDVSEIPDYPGGIEALYKLVGENFQTPKTPDDVKLKGKVYATFVVEKDGSLSSYKILRDIGYGTGEEAIRVLKLCSNWSPGKINGEPVRTRFSIPFSIQ